MNVVLMHRNRVVPYSNNPRKNLEAAINATAKSLGKYGWQQCIVVEPAIGDDPHVIVAGHKRFWGSELLLEDIDQRLEAGEIEEQEAEAAREQWLNIPVKIADDLTDDEIKGYRLADNATAEIDEWDLGKLSMELNELQAAEFDMSALGFQEAELTSYLTGNSNAEENGAEDKRGSEESEGTAPGAGEVTPVGSGNDGGITAEVKQIILSFPSEKYVDVYQRLTAVAEHIGAADYSVAFEHMLTHFEQTRMSAEASRAVDEAGTV